MILLNDYNKSNCYNICEFYFYFDVLGNYKCTETNECPKGYNKLILDEKRCIKELDLIYNISDEKIDYIIAKKDEEIMNFKEDIMKNDKILDNVTNGEDFVQKDDDMLFQVTTTDNQKSNTNKNISKIDLKDCEDKLKDEYKIDKSIPLIIIKIDYYSKDTLIPIIGYEIYHPLNKSKLDLSYCKDILIQLNIPVNIDENNLFKYDPNSEYYTDNCYSYTTEDGTDIILSDRKKEFGKNNMSLCENNCNYTGYDIENKQSSCDCQVKNKIDLVSEIVDNPQKLSDTFSEEKSSSGTSNIITMKCTKTLFTKDGLINNISSYVVSASIVYYLFSILLFIKCGYNLLKKDIIEIINSKKQTKNKGTRKITNTNPPKKFNFKADYNIKDEKKINSNSKSKFNISNNNKSLKLSSKIIKNKNKNTFKRNNKHSKCNKMNSKIININIPNNQIKNEIKTIKFKYNDFELNTLDYSSALIYDKRTCCQYYIALLRIKHPLLFGFCPMKDYNTMIIKLCIFLLSFDIYYVINFAFFNEDVLHKLYEDGGGFDIIYFIPQISISFAVSHIITILIKFIFLSERNIIQVRNQPTYEAAMRISDKVRRNIVCKYILFYILGIIFLFFFWMLLSSFGAVYQNTQIILFESVLVSFAISFIYPIFYNIIPCIFRFCSLSNKEKNLDCLYKISKFLQIL